MHLQDKDYLNYRIFNIPTKFTVLMSCFNVLESCCTLFHILSTRFYWNLFVLQTLLLFLLPNVIPLVYKNLIFITPLARIYAIFLWSSNSDVHVNKDWELYKLP